MLFKLSHLVAAICGSSLVAAQNVPITGAKVASGANAPYRLSIDALQAAGGPQWTLYLRALSQMQKQDATNQLSYFQIAGIHGKPYIQWNNAGAETSNGWEGYCPHGENLFLTWHRPYVLLFEQRLVEIATTIANTYPSSVRAQWVQAASTLRSPYWDWATTLAVPGATVPATFSIRVPNGSGLKTISVPNPLAGYNFPQSALNGQFGTFDEPENRPRIYRCLSPQSYPSSANGLIRSRTYKQWVYDAFTSSTTFDQFASTSSSGTSLEQIHNAIHWDGACGYQFVDADFAAFDPLFMLHHTNIDRLWAYWQFIRPSQAIFSGSYQGSARFNTREGATITPNSPLQPFYASAGRFHTSTSVASIRGFGYTYEGLEYWRKSASQLTTDATQLINRLYGPSSAKRSVEKRAGELTRYFASIRVNAEELDRPCSIGLFVNTTNVGNFIVLMQPATGEFNGKFSLDRAAPPEELAGEKPKNVVDDILAGIRISITKHDGTEQPITEAPSLKLVLENAVLVPPENSASLPVYTDSKTTTAPKKQFQPPN
ncbi:tyrosinase [Ilyonectria robusta]|uniref:tyrosinase n=1 Tax=Ilyonectria robusta TaxID=1079257 RepID=UPI001E8EC163|nr:tyrosinase [Ilyonectria robusta]KAH8658549.1 tyrosinase [Ilyonectria robusta]